MATLPDAVVGAGRSVGRHFSVVGMIPAFLAAGWLWLIASTVIRTGSFNLERFRDVGMDTSFADVGVLLVVTLLLGLLTHPYQFVFTQLLEGYWGGWQPFHSLAAHRINHYRAKRRYWVTRGEAAEVQLIRSVFPRVTDEQLSEDRDGLLKSALLNMDGLSGDAMIASDQVSRYRYRFESQLPERSARTMPTRLGNALREFEDAAGAQYGLDAVVVAGHLSLLPEDATTTYVRDTRQALDLNVRLCMLAMLATPPTALLLARSGPWAFLALIPFGVSYGAYRGSVHAARAYGNAVRFQVDLRRFDLYRALKVPAPRTPAEELQQNRRLIAQLSPAPHGPASAQSSEEGLRYLRE